MNCKIVKICVMETVQAKYIMTETGKAYLRHGFDRAEAFQ